MRYFNYSINRKYFFVSMDLVLYMFYIDFWIIVVCYVDLGRNNCKEFLGFFLLLEKIFWNYFVFGL